MVIDSFQGEHRFLSNFWPCTVRAFGRDWPSVEHAYQWSKVLYSDAADTAQRSLADEIMKIPAGAAKRLGRQLSIDQARFDRDKLSIMSYLVGCKFRNNPDLAERLYITGDAELIKGNTWGDTYWGVCGGLGENHLGRILMQARSDIAPWVRNKLLERSADELFKYVDTYGAPSGPPEFNRLIKEFWEHRRPRS